MSESNGHKTSERTSLRDTVKVVIFIFAIIGLGHSVSRAVDHWSSIEATAKASEQYVVRVGDQFEYIDYHFDFSSVEGPPGPCWTDSKKAVMVVEKIVEEFARIRYSTRSDHDGSCQAGAHFIVPLSYIVRWHEDRQHGIKEAALRARLLEK